MAELFFGTPTGSRLGSLSNGVVFGQILAFSIFSGSLLLVLGAALQCTAQDYGMFLAARMIIGFGGLIAVEASPMFIAEQAYPTHRAVLTAYQLQQPVVPGGALLAAWVTYGTHFKGPRGRRVAAGRFRDEGDCRAH